MKMERYINEHGKECWAGVVLSSPFQRDIFHSVKMNNDPNWEYDDNYQEAFHCDIGSITVLDRRTGFGWRDIETGFRDKAGNFWLASGNCDVRESECKTIGEAIEWIKKHANTCVPEAV
jgi:hypothetical protein